MFDDGFLPLSPINFFEISLEISSLDFKKWKEGIENKKYLLPTSEWLLGQEEKIDLYAGWCNEGLGFYFHSKESFDEPEFPSILSGDSVELFIDTRDVKTSGYNTKFCHHFFFLPKKVEGHDKGEITRFRSEDSHELKPSEDLELSVQFSKHTKMKMFIPASSLHGYDPAQFKRIGFSYRINRYGAPSLHFTARTDEFNLAEEPSLWASCKLV